MKRRTWLKAMLMALSTGAIHTAVGERVVSEADQGRPIEVHFDLAVDPAKEQEMLHFFMTSFRPAAQKQPGYIDLKMLKLSSVLRGPAPAGANYQLVLIFASEELRQKWITSETHKQLWPTIVNTLTSTTYSRLLYEVY